MENLVMLIPPFGFLLNLMISDYRFNKRHLNIDGRPTINKTVFWTSKYLVIVIWAAVVLQSFGIGYSFLLSNFFINATSITLWILGFTGLFIGKSIMGKNFRFGTPEEPINFTITGLFRISRNPMYISLNLTIIASILYTRNPIILLIGLFTIIVHHYIILAEERWLNLTFGRTYEMYCQKVRRYL